MKRRKIIMELSHEDRHDLFEFIKKINPSIDMIDDKVQNLLDAIDKKIDTKIQVRNY